MAQRPTNDFNIDPNVTSGTDLANILNRFQDAIDSGNSGSSRPAYLDAGGLWVREGDPMRLYLYDGTTDRELYNTTDGLVGGSQWKDNGDDIYYNDGNVGIGESIPTAMLHVKESKQTVARFESTNATKAVVWVKDANTTSDNSVGFGARADELLLYAGGTEPRLTIDSAGKVGIGMGDAKGKLHVSDGVSGNPLTSSLNTLVVENDGNAGISVVCGSGQMSAIALHGGGSRASDASIRYIENTREVQHWVGGQQRMTIDSTGNVGIGMTPATRTAKEQLAEWKSRFDARLKAEPKADKKAVTLEITDDAFEVMPTEEALAEWMETRAAGDKLQVAGSASFSRTVNAEKLVSVNSNSYSGGFRATVGNGGDVTLIPVDADGTVTDGTISLGRSKVDNATNPMRWKDGFFIGTVSAGFSNASIFRGGTTGMGTPPFSFQNDTDTGMYRVSDDRLGFTTGGTLRLEINDLGDATFSGTVESKGFGCRAGTSGARTDNKFNIQWGNIGGQAELWIDSTRLGAISTTTRTSQQLIQVLSTLRNATKDETTLEGMRDALSDAIGGIIQDLEHQISTMPVPEEPEVGTMPSDEPEAGTMPSDD